MDFHQCHLILEKLHTGDLVKWMSKNQDTGGSIEIDSRVFIGFKRY